MSDRYTLPPAFDYVQPVWVAGVGCAPRREGQGLVLPPNRTRGERARSPLLHARSYFSYLREARWHEHTLEQLRDYDIDGQECWPKEAGGIISWTHLDP